jgi:WhiB family redox-sensing transcriptional regulator
MSMLTSAPTAFADPWVHHVMRLRWQDDASCRAHLLVADAWFPENEDGHALQAPPEVVATCAACPVRAECLSFAVILDEPYGVWGGVGCRKTRVALRRRWLAGACLRELAAEAVASDVEAVAA